MLAFMLLAACSSDSDTAVRADGAGNPSSDKAPVVETSLPDRKDVSTYQGAVDGVFEFVQADAFGATDVELRGDVQAGAEPGEWILCLLNTTEMPVAACDSKVILPPGTEVPKAVDDAKDPRLIEVPAEYRGALKVVDGTALLSDAKLIAEPKEGVSRTATMGFEVVATARSEPTTIGRTLSDVASKPDPSLEDRSSFEALLGERLENMGLPILGAVPVQEEGEARIHLSGIVVPRELARAIADVLGVPVSIASPIVIESDQATTCQ